MSTTYSLICHDCVKKAKTAAEHDATEVWIGQTSCGGPLTLYEDNTKEQLAAWLLLHAGHDLRFVDDMAYDDGAYAFDPRDVLERMEVMYE